MPVIQKGKHVFVFRYLCELVNVKCAFKKKLFVCFCPVYHIHWGATNC